MPRGKKNLEPPPKSQTPEEIEDASLELESASLTERASKELTPEYIRMLKKIAYYTAKVGLPLQESCLLVDYDYDKFQEDMKLKPIIAQVIRMKETEYKKDLLFTISQRARSGDDKLATWLLERRYPDEYGDKKNKGGGTGDDIVEKAFKFIREFGDATPLISPTAAKATVLELSGERREVVVEVPIAERIDQILA